MFIPKSFFKHIELTKYTMAISDIKLILDGFSCFLWLQKCNVIGFEFRK